MICVPNLQGLWRHWDDVEKTVCVSHGLTINCAAEYLQQDASHSAAHYGVEAPYQCLRHSSLGPAIE